jgi:hypothetical protein
MNCGIKLICLIRVDVKRNESSHESEEFSGTKSLLLPLFACPSVWRTSKQQARVKWIRLIRYHHHYVQYR